MTLRLRNFIVISAVLHGLAIYLFAASASKAAKEIKPPARVTIRQRTAQPAKPATAPLSVPATPKTKPQPKTSSKKEVVKKTVPKPIPVLKPDAPEVAPELPEPETQSEVSESSDSVAYTNEGASAGAEGAQDLSGEGSLISSSIQKPEYTPEAIKARVQGVFLVDVHLDADGRPLEVELIDSPGFGMDERILEALKQAKYNPKRDSSGKGFETWITVDFKLEIP